MRTLLIALSLIVGIGTAKAEAMPEGCYVSYANPGVCWSSSNGVTEWIESTDRALTVYRYGTPIEAIIYEGISRENNRQEWIAYGTETESRRAILANTVTKNTALIKKLRKACGSKCKRIK
jgi:hypothetical protein